MSLGISAAVQRLPSNRRAGDGYSVLGMSPKLAFDFDSEYYRTNGGQKSFSNAMTFARAGLATMVDSDGLIKWAPHNLITYSEQFDNAAWFDLTANGGSAPVRTANAGVAPDGTLTADRVYFERTIADISSYSLIRQNISTVNGTGHLWVKSYDGTEQKIDFRIGGVEKQFTATSEWQKISDSEATATQFQIGIRNPTSGLTSDVLIWGAHLYRSDLGGMVNNPDRGDSYVPTTSSAVYLPRRGHHKYNGDQWVKKGILAEYEARTNVVTYSDQFNNAAWTKAAPTITADAIASPDGNDNADKLVESSTTAHAVYQVPTVTAVAYTFSVFAKSAERTQVNLDFTGGTNGAYFNLSTGEVISSSGTGLTAAITPMGNDWYRCSITQVQSAGAIYPSVSTSVGGARVYLGDGSSGIYIYGAQLEAGSTPSSYIPTSGSTVTRAAETVTVPYANLPWPTPTYIGDELVTDGEFSSTANWVEGNAAWSVTGGALVGTAVPNNQYIGQPVIAISSGTILYVTVSVSSYTSGGLNFTLRDAEVGTNEIPANLGVNGTGTFTTTLVATQTNMWLEVLSIGTTTMTIDNISVREINPLSVSIAMMGEMDYADEGETLQVRQYLWALDVNNKIEAFVDASATKTGDMFFRQYDSGIADPVSTADDNYFSPDLNVPFNIASRHGSTFINGAVDGVALTANTTPTALPDLSTTNLNLAYDFMGTISEFRIWDRDIGDTGIAEATA